MTAGSDAIEQAILQHTQDGGIWPVMFIAKASGHDISDLSARQSFAGAARRLHMKDLTKLWWVTAPTVRITLHSPSNSGDVMCVSQPEVELTYQLLWRLRDMAQAVFDPQFDNFNAEDLERSFQQIALRLGKSIESD